jgi:hypothetical protein
LESTKDSKVLNPNLLILNTTGCTYSNAALLTLTRVADGALHSPFTRLSLPLAEAAYSDSTGVVTAEAPFRGASVSRMPLYKVDGNYWAVTFNTNVGDIPALVAKPTKYLTEGAMVSVYDNVVTGRNPQRAVLDGLLTGVQYNVRMQAYTRGASRGYSNFSVSEGNLASAVPSGAPPTVLDFAAEDSLAVTEVQQVAVYASRLQEIQTITTSAEAYAGVQQFMLTADNGKHITGNFSLRFPEVQTIVMTAEFANEVFGSFQLVYSYYDYDMSLTAITETTSCLAVTSTAAEVQTALELLTHVDTVEVVRSGYGGYSDSFGYSWSITFTGNMVAGNVQPLVVKYGNEGGTCVNSLPSGLAYAASTTNENQALGVDTEVQVLNLTSTDHVAYGEYSLYFGSTGLGTKTTACIAWDASAVTVQEALLDGIQSIDNILVERSGTGTSASNYGYVYNIYFTGNAMHARSGSGSALPLLTYSQTGCGSFQHLVDGVLTNLTSSEASANVTRTRAQGYNLPAATSAEYLLSELENMPNFVAIDSTQRSLADDDNGYQFTVNFGMSMGRTPVMVCGMGPTLTSVPAVCSHLTLIEGNAIEGSFVLGTSGLLAYDISAVDMQNELQLLSGVGNVTVSRSDKDLVGGYVWTVTYLTAIGNQPALSFSNLLSGSGATVTVATLQDGNYLNGTYVLNYNGKVTSPISYDASASALKAALIIVVGSTTVTKSIVSSEGGAVYSVSLRAQSGDLPLLVPYFRGTLTGVGAVVNVRESVKGAAASGSSLKVSYQSPLYCSQSEVLSASCGAPLFAHSIEVSTARGILSQVLSVPTVYNVQIVRVSATDLNDPLYFQGEDATGSFQLSYNGSTTGNINSHASALDVRSAVESLTSVHTVAVSRDYSADLLQSTVNAYPGSLSLECALSSCDFSSLPAGELVRVGGVWYKVAASFEGSSMTLPLAPENDSSVLATYSGTVSLVGAPLYRWARGYEWSVTFLSVDGVVLPLSSPKHKMNPLSATVAIRPADCVGCVYVGSLTVGNQYFLKIRAENVDGYGPYSEVTIG